MGTVLVSPYGFPQILSFRPLAKENQDRPHLVSRHRPGAMAIIPRSVLNPLR